MRPRVTLLLGLLGAAVVLAVWARLAAGGRATDVDGAAWEQILALRRARVTAGLIVGASLGAAGALLQSLLRNPLASPEVLGMSAGASLAVMAGVYAGAIGGADGAGWSGPIAWLLGGAWSAGPALAGALGALAVVYGLSQRRGLVEPVSLVLTGVVVSTLCGAGVMLLQHLMPDGGLTTARLLTGSLADDTPRGVLWGAGAGAVAVIVLGAWYGPALDAASLGDDEARSVGVPLGALRLGLVLGAGVLTAGAVSIAGPVGFVGLLCPHAVRAAASTLGAGPLRHRAILAGAAMAGAALVVAGDALVRLVPVGTGRLPLGVLMTFLGAPVLLALLRSWRAARA